MVYTYEDFLQSVAEEDRAFVEQMHARFLEFDCKADVKEAKQGFAVSYYYLKEKKKIVIMNYVFRKKGMLVRIYARHIDRYQQVLNCLPEAMKMDVIKGGDCKRLTGVSVCSPTCTAGYEFEMDGKKYQKCKNSAFFWLVSSDSKDFILQILENELREAKLK